MEISQPDETNLRFEYIDPVNTELLRRIPSSADPKGSDAAHERLFSSPTENEDEELAFTEDWKEYVEPGLAHLFQSAIDVIAGDLKKLRVDAMSGNATLTIPIDHLESWVHGLTQARLVLTERHRLSEEELDNAPPLAADPKSFLFLQLHFYGMLQSIFLKVLDGRDASDGGSAAES